MNANLIDKYLLQFQSATERERGRTNVNANVPTPPRLAVCHTPEGLPKRHCFLVACGTSILQLFFFLPFAVYDDTCDVGVGLSLCFLCDSLANIVLIIDSIFIVVV